MLLAFVNYKTPQHWLLKGSWRLQEVYEVRQSLYNYYL